MLQSYVKELQLPFREKRKKNTDLHYSCLVDLLLTCSKYIGLRWIRPRFLGYNIFCLFFHRDLQVQCRFHKSCSINLNLAHKFQKHIQMADHGVPFCIVPLGDFVLL